MRPLYLMWQGPSTPSLLFDSYVLGVQRRYFRNVASSSPEANRASEEGSGTAAVAAVTFASVLYDAAPPFAVNMSSIVKE